jgi:uncharacterized membrane protein YhhN
MLTGTLTVIALITAVIHVRAEYKGPPIQKYIFKPLTTSLIILIAVLSERGDSESSYRLLIIAGLLFSLAGDVFLMRPSDRFIAGLVSFLIAHVLYIAAFVTDAGVATFWWVIPFLIYGAIVYAFLAAHVGKLRVPVIIYMVAILIMAWQAAGRWYDMRETGRLLAFIGAVLFVISDSVLALNRFRQPFKAARALTMGTYYSAQWFIALSIASF